ncbi:Serine/threonine-protein kinase rio1 [Babesia sp. Xinjiang]|uniref:Serine/threonine-protein kinase rio1 n=1 Tax=Babesia sp. Xinjiang TaxID=462227 RepID=UPI000A22BEC0|nr:Serine/threonine-protein kinase rio1 [Babesia sp. Xinjiang]ORM39418.1 Serine/threonine-protein kinase rio1 [Babesia sp. Xinjiang]
MVDIDYSRSSSASDAEEPEIAPRQTPKRHQDFRQSNFFFAVSAKNQDTLRSNQIYKRNHYEKGLTKDKRTTVQQVLDKRTYVRLRKLCGQGVFHYMHGTISTGKEANVFEAETQHPIIDETEPCGTEEEVIGVISSQRSSGEAGGALSPTSPSETTGATADDLTNRLAKTSIGSTLKCSDVGQTNLQSDEHGPSRVAIKVYKTSILVFKDRSRYIEGEFRFRRAYVGTKNPRKMVAQWAEKEFRNLRRIALSGIYCPAPIALRDHILVMDLILDGDVVAPKLENLGPRPLFEWQTIYAQTVSIMRTLFQECKLIHGDLSSFNMLYSKGKLYVIDTSQALENDHPNAMPFLKRDCENVTRFFEAVAVMHHGQNEEMLPYNKLNLVTSEQLFCFIVARSLDGLDLKSEANARVPFPQVEDELWQEEVLGSAKSFWSIEDDEIERDSIDCVEKMRRFNKFGASKDILGLVIKKRKAYLSLCRAVYDFLTGPIFANEDCKERISWMKNVNFDKQLPMNISQMPLELAESAVEHAENVIIAMNAVIEEGSSEDEDNGRDTDDYEEDEETDEVGDTGMRSRDAHSESPIKEAPKFSGKIPDGVDPRDWKKMVKEYNRERRKHKIPKHIKKKYGTSKA